MPEEILIVWQLFIPVFSSRYTELTYIALIFRINIVVKRLSFENFV